MVDTPFSIIADGSGREFFCKAQVLVQNVDANHQTTITKFTTRKWNENTASYHVIWMRNLAAGAGTKNDNDSELSFSHEVRY